MSTVNVFRPSACGLCGVTTCMYTYRLTAYTYSYDIREEIKTHVT